jgi:hypothetical protein
MLILERGTTFIFTLRRITVFKLSNKVLLETYKLAIKLGVSQDFIILLKKEIHSRIDQGVLNNIQEQDNENINSV